MKHTLIAVLFLACIFMIGCQGGNPMVVEISSSDTDLAAETRVDVIYVTNRDKDELATIKPERWFQGQDSPRLKQNPNVAMYEFDGGGLFKSNKSATLPSFRDFKGDDSSYSMIRVLLETTNGYDSMDIEPVLKRKYKIRVRNGQLEPDDN